MSNAPDHRSVRASLYYGAVRVFTLPAPSHRAKLMSLTDGIVEPW